jgi:outer membrane lipoprotein-sorting protein
MRAMDNSRRLRRAAVAAASVALIAGVFGAMSGYRGYIARAYAEDARSEMARAYRDARAWRAHVEERELVGEGVYRTISYRIAVAGPNRYRVESTERDENGREVTSVTIRNGSTVYSSTRTEDVGSSIIEVRNVPPTLGAVADNVLGQRVRDLARAGTMRYLGRDTVRGRAALRLSVEPGHLVWVDGDTSLPLREQLLSGKTVTHDTEVLSFEADTAIDFAEFEPEPIDTATRTTEDLGFRSADLSSAPHSLLGFVPRALDVPSEWLLVESGYTEPVVHADGAPNAPVWVTHFDTPLGPVLVTQSRGNAGTWLDRSAADGTDGPIITEIGGQSVAYYADEWRTHATTQIEGVMLSIEGLMSADELLPLVSRIR